MDELASDDAIDSSLLAGPGRETLRLAAKEEWGERRLVKTLYGLLPSPAKGQQSAGMRGGTPTPGLQHVLEAAATHLRARRAANSLHKGGKLPDSAVLSSKGAATSASGVLMASFCHGAAHCPPAGGGALTDRDRRALLGARCLFVLEAENRDFWIIREIGQGATVPELTLPFLTFIRPYLTLTYLTLPYLTLPYLTLPYLTLPYLTLPYLTSP